MCVYHSFFFDEPPLPQSASERFDILLAQLDGDNSQNRIKSALLAEGIESVTSLKLVVEGHIRQRGGEEVTGYLQKILNLNE